MTITRSTMPDLLWPGIQAIFGNGYNSHSQKATLFVVDIATGTVETIVAEKEGR